MLHRALLLAASLLLPGRTEARSPVPAAQPDPGKWLQAMEQIVATLKVRHPAPFARVGERELAIEVDSLRRVLPLQDDAHAVVSLMRLVASLRDGHTQLQPAHEPAFARWYPIRFYRFRDGLFVTVADRRHRELVGARVLRIGTRSADEALARAESVMGADNDWGRTENLFALSNATMLYGLDVTPTPDSLALEVQTSAGTRRVVLRPVTGEDGSFDGRFRGEMFPPFRGGDVDWVAGFGDRAPMDFRKHDPRLPLFLRDRFYFFFERLADGPTLYAQINFMQEDDTLRFDRFTDSLFASLDRAPVRRLVLDLRYNSGGNGALAPRFADALVRRADRAPWGQLYVLTGRKTFSAAILLLGVVRKAVPAAVIVGEPAGAGLNHYGDPMTFDVPGSGLRLNVSTIVHQMARSDDVRPFVAVNLPVTQSAAQYFAGQDPALALVLGPEDTRAIETIAAADGPDAALAVLRARLSRFRGVAGWEPFDEAGINALGYRVLRDRRDPATASRLFLLNTLAFPDSWNAWDSYGEALAAAGRLPPAVEAYRTSLALNPGNDGARRFLAEHSGAGR